MTGEILPWSCGDFETFSGILTLMSMPEENFLVFNCKPDVDGKFLSIKLGLFKTLTGKFFMLVVIGIKDFCWG